MVYAQWQRSMRELTTTEQELIDQLVAFWHDESKGLSAEFYRALAALGRQQQDDISLHRLLTDEVFCLRTPKHSSEYRQQFTSAEAYRSSLIARAVALAPSAHAPIPQSPSTDKEHIAAPAESVAVLSSAEPFFTPESFDDCDVLTDLATFWATGYMIKDLEAHIQSFVGPADLKAQMLRVFDRVSRLGRSAYSVGFLGYEENQKGFRQYLLRHVTQAAVWRAEQEEAKRIAIEQEAARLARAKAEEEAKEKAREEFEALGERMGMATSREELSALIRQRMTIATKTGQTFSYENHCWRCKRHISSQINPQCSQCDYYICECGACFCWELRAQLKFNGLRPSTTLPLMMFFSL